MFVAAEAAPYAAIGGLSQVLYFLPKALQKQGVEVVVFVPKYGTINEKKYKLELFHKNLRVPTGNTTGVTELICNVKVKWGNRREPTVYFLENMEYYEQRANVYGYGDDHIRFAILSRAALEFARTGKVKPNVIHVNDWHTGYLPNYLRTVYAEDPVLKSVSTVFTIHNLRSQGLYDFRFASPMNFDDGKSRPLGMFDPNMRKQNPLKRGIMYADLVNTVSETYAREIITPEYGEGLHELLKELRTKVFGVLNGLDYTEFDPATDKIIKRNFSLRTPLSRAENKKELQKIFQLKEDLSLPVIGMVGRLDDQKGLDLVSAILPELLEEYEMQFVIMGTGEPRYREFFQKLEEKYPGRVGCHLMANWELPRRIFAGADMLLLPSRFEPGGIVVIEGMRYGAVPIVRATGGLADIVSDYDPEKGVGNGFTFHTYSKLALFGAIVRALQVFLNKKAWNQMVYRALREDFSWEQAAIKYLDLYERAIEFRRDRQNPVQSIMRKEE
jgi:starch synthase